MNKKYFLIGTMLIIILVSACESRPILECPKPIECQKCPEKICPSCPSCEEVKQQDKPLIVEYRGYKIDESKGEAYNRYSILNPNDRKILALIKTYCYDENDTETVNEKEKHFIEGKSEAFYNPTFGSGYWYAKCPKGWKKTRVEAEIID